MTVPRVKAAFWVSMALRLGSQDGRPGMVLRKGDPDAGGGAGGVARAGGAGGAVANP